MAREHRYQQGKFENYIPERDEMSGYRDERTDFEVRRKGAVDVGGTYNPAQRGVHRGKGPRNYTRSDERILEDINDRLCDNPYIDATEIDVSISQGNVVLSGSVENRESKRLAEDIAESVTGVLNVENTLRVTKHGI